MSMFLFFTVLAAIAAVNSAIAMMPALIAARRAAAAKAPAVQESAAPVVEIVEIEINEPAVPLLSYNPLAGARPFFAFAEPAKSAPAILLGYNKPAEVPARAAAPILDAAAFAFLNEPAPSAKAEEPAPAAAAEPEKPAPVFTVIIMINKAAAANDETGPALFIAANQEFEAASFEMVPPVANETKSEPAPVMAANQETAEPETAKQESKPAAAAAAAKAAKGVKAVKRTAKKPAPVVQDNEGVQSDLFNPVPAAEPAPVKAAKRKGVRKAKTAPGVRAGAKSAQPRAGDKKN